MHKILLALCILIPLCYGFTLRRFPLLDNADDLKYCYSKTPNPYRLYATTTSYDTIRNHSYPIKEYQIETCKPHYFYLFSRHATRYPSAEKIQAMQDNLPLFRDRIIAKGFNSLMCLEDLEALNQWQFKFKVEDGNKLTLSGKKEAYFLGDRYKTYYASLLDKPYSSDVFKFGATSRNRSATTAQSFFAGLFGEENLSKLNLPIKNDILQFHKICQTYMEKKDDSNFQFKLFLNSPDIDMLLHQVSRRIEMPVDFKDVSVMFNICKYEYTILGSSPWCAIFTTNHLKILEYYEDLMHMQYDGYIDPLNTKQTCPLYNHLLTQFDEQIKHSDKFSDLYFSHAGALKKLIAALGLFKDTITYDAKSPSSEYKNRKWRASYMSPFLGNLGFLLSNCEDGSYKVTVFLNEEPVLIPGCGSKDCDYNTFVSLMSDLVKDCDLKEICSPK